MLPSRVGHWNTTCNEVGSCFGRKVHALPKESYRAGSIAFGVDGAREDWLGGDTLAALEILLLLLDLDSS